MSFLQLYTQMVQVEYKPLEKDNPGFYNLLKTWKDKTGCPMLLNTSLNIKGKPIVNNRFHADKFEKEYNVKVV